MAKKKANISKSDVRQMQRFAKRNPVLAAIIVVLVIGVLIWQGVKENANKVTVPMDGLYVHYLDIGQGDSELVCCDGEYMLIDGSVPDEGDNIVAYLKNHNIDKLDYVVCTHGHADHCGGLDEVIKKLEVETIFTSPHPGDRPAYEYFVRAVDNAGLALTVPQMGETYKLGEAEFEFIGPLEEYENINDNSLVMRLTYGDTSFLFTGDMTAKAEKDLVNDNVNVKCDVLKVGHHGSSGSTSYRFLYEAEPSIAVISCGRDNSYGHPHEEALSRLNDADVTVYRTDLDGTVIIFSDGMKVQKAA